MPIAFSCPSCAEEYNVPDDYADRQVVCKQCGTHMLVPALPAADGDSEEAQWQRMVEDVESSNPTLLSRKSDPPPPKAPPSKQADEAYTADGMRVWTGPRKFEYLDYPGVDWLDDFMPPMLIFLGMAVPFFLGIFNVFEKSESWGRDIFALLLFWGAFVVCVVPMTLAGVTLAGKILKFPLPDSPYKRMLATCCVPSSLGVVLGFFIGDFGSLVGILVGIFLAFPVLWLLFHLRLGEAFLCLCLCALLGMGSLYISGLGIAWTARTLFIATVQEQEQQQSASSPFNTSPRGTSPSAHLGPPPPRELVPGVRADERGRVANKPRSVDQWNQLKRTFSGAAVEAAKRYGQPLPSLTPPASVFQPPPSSTASFDPNWTGLSRLDDPVALRGWFIRPPADLTLDVGRVLDDADHVTAVWRGVDREFRFEIIPRPRSDQQRAWVIEPTDTTVAPRDADLLQWPSRGASTFDVGRIAGRPWMRYAWRDDRLQHKAFVQTPEAMYQIVCEEPLQLGGEPREHVMYLLADGDRWVRVQMQWLAGAPDVGHTLEAAARTVRPLTEVEAENVRALLSPAGLITLDDAQWRLALSTLFARDPAASESAALKLLASHDPVVRARAMDMLEHYATEKSAPDLRNIVAGEDVPAARRAMALLKRIKPGELGLMDQLIYDMKWSMPEGDQNTLRTLAELSPPADREHRKTMADMLAKIVGSSQGLSQRYAIEALGKWGDESHVDALAPLLDQPSLLVTTTVIPAIGRLGGEKAAQVLVDHWAQPEVSFVAYKHYIDALSAIGPPAEDHVLRLLRSSDSRLQEAAIRTLEAVGTRKSVSVLVRVIRENETLADLGRDTIRAVQDRLRQR